MAEANRYITIRTKHIDSEASENEQRMKSYKRKHPVAGILNLDFNNMITQEVCYVNFSSILFEIPMFSFS